MSTERLNEPRPPHWSSGTDHPSAHPPIETQDGRGALAVRTGWESAVTSLEAEARRLMVTAGYTASLELYPIKQAVAAMPSRERARSFYDAASWLKKQIPNDQAQAQPPTATPERKGDNQ